MPLALVFRVVVVKSAPDFDIMSLTCWLTAKASLRNRGKFNADTTSGNAPIRVRLSFASAYASTASEEQRGTRPLFVALDGRAKEN